MKVVKCPQCGASVEHGSRFCNYCGAALAEEATVDIKKREYRFETINHAKIRREELKAQQRLDEMKAENERLEKLKQLNEQSDKSMRQLYIFAAFGIAVLLLLYFVTRNG